MPLPLITPRLLIRKLHPDDAAAVYAYRSDPTISRYQTWSPQNEEEIATFIEGMRDLDVDTEGTWYQCGIILTEAGILIGDIGLHFPPAEPRQAEIGITLAGSHQGCGYATEALQGVVECLFTDLGKHRVYGRVDPRNARSIALLTRLGMRMEGHLRETVWDKGEWADDLIFALIEWEWRGMQRAGNLR